MQAGVDWPGVVNHKELYEGLQEVAEEHGLKVGARWRSSDIDHSTAQVPAGSRVDS
jgi:hypothetical protein